MEEARQGGTLARRERQAVRNAPRSPGSRAATMPSAHVAERHFRRSPGEEYAEIGEQSQSGRECQDVIRDGEKPDRRDEGDQEQTVVVRGHLEETPVPEGNGPGAQDEADHAHADQEMKVFVVRRHARPRQPVRGRDEADADATEAG